MKPLIAFTATLVALLMVVLAIWSHDVWSDRSRTVLVRTATPIFAGSGEGCDGTRIATASPNTAFQVKRIRYWKSCATIDVVLLDGRKGHILLGEGDVSITPPAGSSRSIIAPTNQNQLAIGGFFFGSLFTVVGWVCSLMILRKMRLDGFGIWDLWNPIRADKLYRGYVQEAKRRNWSLLPVYIPAILGTVFFCYFLVAVVLVLRDTF
jgi:hypothetical protein